MGRAERPGRDVTEQGSSVLLAIFVLALVTSVGLALMFLAERESLMSKADLRNKRTFYMSEGGLEDGRATVYDINKTSFDPGSLDEELQWVAGPDNVIDFDIDALQPTYDGAGRLTGFGGYNDDRPLRSVTGLGDGWYIAFMNNDPADGLTSTVDTNQLVMLTAVGLAADRSLEITQAIVRYPPTFPGLPATITILGPNAQFDGGDSNAKLYTGNDGDGHCPGGDPAIQKPTVGVIGAASEASAEPGAQKPLTYVEGVTTGLDTIDDLTLDPDLPSLWTDCQELVDLARLIKGEAHVIGDATTPEADLGVPGAPKIVFIDDDYVINGNFSGAGLLFVTGELTIDGRASWYGPIFAVGQGDFLRAGAGVGDLLGGIIVADVEGPDQTLFTADDCAGEDDIPGTGDDGVAESSYLVNGAGNSVTGYCSTAFIPWEGLRPFEIVSFRQR